MPDILIIPQRGTTSNPVIQFSGSAANNIRMEVLPSGSVAYIGSSGSLFNITNNLLGSLMSVGDVSGLPIFEVFSDDRVIMGKYNANTLYVSGTRVGVGKIPTNATLDVSGSISISGSIRSGIAGNSSANTPALRVTSAGTETYQAAIAIQQLTNEGDTIIFADFDQYTEWNFMHENGANQFIIHGGDGTNTLGSNTFYSPNGTAKTGYKKHIFDQANGNMYVGGSVGIGNSSPSYKLHVSGDIYANGGWFRVSGTQGYYFETYGGGWYMNDSSWIRAYNDKAIITNNEIRGTVFKDANDATYYVDPATGTNLNGTLVNNGGTAMTGGWNRNLLLSSTFPVIVFNSNSTKYSGIGVDYSNAASGMYFWVNGSSADISGTATVALGINTGNFVSIYGSARAPIFYDSDDTGYYVDPASTGTSAIFAGNITVANGRTDAYIYMGDTDEGSRSIHNNSNRIGFLRQDGNWGSYCDDSGYWQSEYSIRGPLFYDSNDTNYYVDPHSTSNLNVAKANYFCGSAANAYGQYKGYDNNNHFITIRGAVSGTTSSPTIIGAHQTTFVEYAEVNDSTGWFFKTAGTGNYDIVSRITRNHSSFEGSARAPLFYDSNDTNYYVDPASTSRVNIISFVSGATFGPYFQYNNQNNLRLQGGSNGTEIGISGYDYNGNWRLQLYGNSEAYGFLNGNWAGWDLKKLPSGNLYLNNQTTYYIGTNEIYYNRVYGLADIRSPIFYDNDNTAYYCNPAGTSQFVQLDVINSIGSNDDVRYGTRMYDSTSMGAGVGGQLVLGYKYTSGGTYTEGAILKTYKLDGTDGNYGSGLKIQVRNHGENLATKVQIDGSGNMVIGGNMTNNPHSAVSSTRLFFGGANDTNAYYIGTNFNNYGGTYTKLDLRWHTGIRMGARPNYGGIRIFSDETVGTQIASFGETDANVRVSNTLFVIGDTRSPIFYDYNDTGYYVDPASVSYLYEPRMAWRSLIGEQSYDATLFDGGTSYRPGIVVRGQYPHIDLISSNINNGNHGPTLRFVAYDSANVATGNFKHWVMGCAGTNATRFSIGYDANNTNPHYGIYGAGTPAIWIENDFNVYFQSSIRPTIIYDRNDSGFYLDPNSTSVLWRPSAATQQRWGISWRAIDAGAQRTGQTSDTDYWTTTIGWGTSYGTWADYWKYGAGAFDCWGNSTDHPQGSGYVHAQGIQSGIHYATSNGATAYGWQMVGAADAGSRWWLRGKWGGTTYSWYEIALFGRNVGGSLYADTFYDSGNTNYYVDPASTSNLNRLSIQPRNDNYYVGTVSYVNSVSDWQSLTNTQGQFTVTQMNNFAGGGFSNYPSSVYTYGSVLSWRTENHSFQLYAAHTGDLSYKTQWGNDNYSGWLYPMVYGRQNGGGGSIYGTIFYDQNDTNYYVDGNGGTALKYLRVNGDWGSSPFGSGHETFTVTGTHASMCQRQTNGNLGYWLHHIDSGGNYYLYGGRGATNGSGWDWAYRAYTNTDGNYVEFRTSARAPIFYDRDNTGYYIDGAGTSVANNVQITTLGVGTAASGTAGEIRATNNITAYYSDERLKTRLGKIENALEKVKSLDGFYFSPNDTAMALGYKKTIDVGVSAQQVKEILPEIIAPAPIDPQYMTVRYEKMIPLLIEAIKEQQKQIEALTERLSALEKTK